MKKIFFYVLCLTIFMQNCSINDDISDPIKMEEANFPAHIEEYGKTVAKELRQTVKNLNELGVDYSNADNSVAFKDQFHKDLYEANPTIIKSRASINQMQMEPEVFAERVRNLTELQIKFIKRIINECDESISYQDLCNRLISVNKDIYTQVPKIQQERLLYVTAVLYYGINEIHDIEKRGQMFATPHNNMQLLRIKTRTEPGGSLGDSCRKFLATVWTIAIGEPTPAGEIVAAVATVIIGGVLLYEVIVCKKSIDCSAKYADCVNFGTLPRWQCYDCFKYCQGQNVWDCPRPY